MNIELILFIIMEKKINCNYLGNYWTFFLDDFTLFGFGFSPPAKNDVMTSDISGMSYFIELLSNSMSCKKTIKTKLFNAHRKKITGLHFYTRLKYLL